MQAVIIAGGLGKRLRPLTLTRPKALVPLVNKPQVVHILEALPPSCGEAILSVNYRFAQVRDFFRDHEFPVKVRVIDEPTPLGTAGALKNVEHLVHGTFAVYNGDIVDSIDFDDLVRAHRKGGGIGTIAVWPVEEPSAFGVVEVEAGRITRFTEKPAPGETESHLVSAGRYIFEPEVFDFIDKSIAVSMEREVFPRLVERGLTAYSFEGWWSDAGTLTNYLNAQHLLLAAGQGKIATDADVTSGTLHPPVAIGAGSFVEGRLGPDVVLGRSCKVGRAVVRNTALLDGVSIDDKAEVLGSIIGAGVAVGEGAQVRDSILQDGVQVPPHAEIFDGRVAA